MDKFTIVVATSANMDISKMLCEPGKALPLLHNFNANLRDVLGVAHLWSDGENLLADIVLKPDFPDVLLDGWPAVGGIFKNSETSNYCIAGLIKQLSICTSPNVDKNIKTLRDQLQICMVPQRKINTFEFSTS